ncbi:ferritin-like domain-containing protein [Niabella insulamsoli]|uniref:ferritin-like domain-containing protein n=1 Tax=Niabella insulamsoli TaxID=3144874 RepID=UPI0031FD0E39
MDTPEMDKQVEALNDLIQINNDRIAGYKEAIEVLEQDKDLEPLFQRMINDSVDFNESLERLVILLGGEVAQGTSGAGKVYRAWMELKAFLTAGDRRTILDSCVTGEETALRAYDNVLETYELVDTVRPTIAQQKDHISQALQEVVALKQAAG